MQNLMLILKLLPLLIEVLKAIEAAVPGAGKGEEKLAAVRKILESADGVTAALWPTIEKTIGVLVELFNKTGWGGK